MTQQELPGEVGGSKFSAPTMEMVMAEGIRIGLPKVECEKLYAHYEMVGWKVGRNKMKSWTAAMKHWKLVWASRRPDSGPGQTVWELTKIAEACEKAMAQLRLKHCAEGPLSNQWDTEENRAEFVRLLRRVREINKQITNM